MAEVCQFRPARFLAALVVALAVEFRQVKRVAATVPARRDGVAERAPIGYILEADEFLPVSLFLIDQDAPVDGDTDALADPFVDLLRQAVRPLGELGRPAVRGEKARVVPEEQRQSVRQCVADDTASRYLTRSGRTVPGDHLAAHIRRVSEPLYVRRRREFYTLWAMAALTFGVGDLVTTLWGVRYTPGVFEGNPIVATILARFGPAGFVVSKLVALGLLLWFGVQAAHQNDHRTYYAIPILATVLGVGLTVESRRMPTASAVG